jgi:hypothetical protein
MARHLCIRISAYVAALHPHYVSIALLSVEWERFDYRNESGVARKSVN